MHGSCNELGILLVGWTLDVRVPTGPGSLPPLKHGATPASVSGNSGERSRILYLSNLSVLLIIYIFCAAASPICADLTRLPRIAPGTLLLLFVRESFCCRQMVLGTAVSKPCSCAVDFAATIEFQEISNCPRERVAPASAQSRVVGACSQCRMT